MDGRPTGSAFAEAFSKAGQYLCDAWMCKASHVRHLKKCDSVFLHIFQTSGCISKVISHVNNILRHIETTAVDYYRLESYPRPRKAYKMGGPRAQNQGVIL